MLRSIVIHDCPGIFAQLNHSGTDLDQAGEIFEDFGGIGSVPDPFAGYLRIHIYQHKSRRDGKELDEESVSPAVEVLRKIGRAHEITDEDHHLEIVRDASEQSQRSEDIEHEEDAR